MYYKFLGKRYVEPTIAGSLRFGRLRYYQLLEVVTGDEWIGDRQEGTATTRVDAVLDGRPEQAELRQRLADAVISAEGVGIIEIRGSTVRSEVDCFVFCIAEGDLAQLVAHMCSADRARYAYDGCFRMTDPAEILRRIWADGTVDGQPLQTLFIDKAFGQMRYEWREHDIHDGPPASGDPFVKAGKYSAQREWRFVLLPRGPIERDSLTVCCPGIAELLAEVKLDVVAQPMQLSDFSETSDDQLVSEIRSIWLPWMAAKKQRDDEEEASYQQQKRADPASTPAARRRHHGRCIEISDEMEAIFNRDLRARLQKVYFEFRSRHPELDFSQIDKELVRGLSAGLLSMSFNLEPFRVRLPSSF